MNESVIREAITTGSKFGSYTQSQIEDVVRWKICDAAKLRGQGDMDSNMVYAITTKITEVIMRDYPSMTDKEFGLVLEMGVSGEFGRDTWVNGGMVLQWLRLYQSYALRIAIIDELNESRNKHRKTKEEIEDLNRQAFDVKAHSAYDYYKENNVIFGDDPRAFHLPQWASIVYKHYREQGKIPEPDAKRLVEAGLYADAKIAEHLPKKEYMPAAREDWSNSYLLERYFEDVKNKRL